MQRVSTWKIFKKSRKEKEMARLWHLWAEYYSVLDAKKNTQNYWLFQLFFGFWLAQIPRVILHKQIVKKLCPQIGMGFFPSYMALAYFYINYYYKSKKLTKHNVLQSDENLKWVIFAIIMRLRIVKLNDYDEQREQPLHPLSIIEHASSERLCWVF